MTKLLTPDAVRSFRENGYCFPVRAMAATEAARYRARLEAHEARIGGPLQSTMRHKTHLLFTWVLELVKHPTILDAVEDILGPDLLCWTTNFFIKEPGNPDFVSWHQDSTYWGLEPPDVATAWLALSDAPVESGAMRFLPGSHTLDQIPHRDTFAAHNLLTRGQEIAVAVDEAKAVDVPLKAGEISLHHVRLVHGSKPNVSADRRIGLAIRYVPTYVRQTKVNDSAMLVRGRDVHGHFDLEPEPKADLDAAALAAHADACNRKIATFYAGTDIKTMRV